MLRAFKTEINPTAEQRVKIHKTIGTCRYMYNFYVARNGENYRNGGKFITGKAFEKWLNHEYLPEHPELSWIKEVSTKSVKRALEDGNAAFTKFFNGKAGYPNFKKKNHSDAKMYFVKNNPKDTLCERHRVKVPSLGWVRLKEKGYIPTTKQGYVIKSGTISMKAGRYYISALVEVPNPQPETDLSGGIGIDLGIKDFAVCSDGTKFKNINKTGRIKKLEKKLRREQRKLSRKYEALKREKGEAAQRTNLQKQKRKVQKLHHRLDNIRTDYVNKSVSRLAKTKPSYMVIEDLNVSGMMKNRHLAKAVASQKFYEFRTKLGRKCKLHGIELRVADRFYPSSKLCHCCGNVKKDLKLSDRTYRCICGYVEDRDFNASLNLRDAEIYSMA